MYNMAADFFKHRTMAIWQLSIANNDYEAAITKQQAVLKDTHVWLNQHDVTANLRVDIKPSDRNTMKDSRAEYREQ